MTFTRLWPVFTSLLYLLNIAIAVYSSIMLISSKRDPVKTLSWVMVMILLPYIGIVLYFFFGRNFRKDKMFSRKGARDLGLRKELCKETVFLLRPQFPQGQDVLPQGSEGSRAEEGAVQGDAGKV